MPRYSRDENGELLCHQTTVEHWLERCLFALWAFDRSVTALLGASLLGTGWGRCRNGLWARERSLFRGRVYAPTDPLERARWYRRNFSMV